MKKKIFLLAAIFCTTSIFSAQPEKPCYLVIGASGAGKSTFCAALLGEKLKKEALDEDSQVYPIGYSSPRTKKERPAIAKEAASDTKSNIFGIGEFELIETQGVDYTELWLKKEDKQEFLASYRKEFFGSIQEKMKNDIKGLFFIVRFDDLNYNQGMYDLIDSMFSQVKYLLDLFSDDFLNKYQEHFFLVVNLFATTYGKKRKEKFIEILKQLVIRVNRYLMKREQFFLKIFFEFSEQRFFGEQEKPKVSQKNGKVLRFFNPLDPKSIQEVKKKMDAFPKEGIPKETFTQLGGFTPPPPLPNPTKKSYKKYYMGAAVVGGIGIAMAIATKGLGIRKTKQTRKKKK